MYWAVANWGYMQGTSETTFSPDEDITRGMFVTILGRMSGMDNSGYNASSFIDITVGSYYASHVEWAVERGIVKGIGENLFAPNLTITRQDMVVMLANYAEMFNYELPVQFEGFKFTDMNMVSDYARNAVFAIGRAGIATGKGGDVFAPKANLTRAEAVVVIDRFMELVHQPVCPERLGTKRESTVALL